MEARKSERDSISFRFGGKVCVLRAFPLRWSLQCIFSCHVLKFEVVHFMSFIDYPSIALAEYLFFFVLCSYLFLTSVLQ